MSCQESWNITNVRHRPGWQFVNFSATQLLNDKPNLTIHGMTFNGREVRDVCNRSGRKYFKVVELRPEVLAEIALWFAESPDKAAVEAREILAALPKVFKPARQLG